MRLLLLPMIMLIVVNLVVDRYIWGSLSRAFGRRWPANLHVFLSGLLLAMAVVIVALERRRGKETVLLADMWMLFGYLTVYVPKLLYVALSLLGRLPRLWRRRPWRPAEWLAVAVALTACGAMWWGALVTRHSCQVREVEITCADLPEAFDGYRLAQISDLHVGTFGSDTTFTARVVAAVNALQPDLVVFTGDIVNRHSSELPAHAAPLSRLSAPDGVVSILGNHDYGDYSEWPTPQAKAADQALLRRLQASMGWRLLLNEQTLLRRGGDSIALVGVENWGDPPFPTYGDLRLACPNAADSTFKILLTHNPAHWVAEVADHDGANFALTLAGHTHAMQIAVAGWSPARYRYPTWGGLYADAGGSRRLYVNIGLGTVAMPMRVGATPEITLITLRRGPDASSPRAKTTATTTNP